MSNVTTTRNGFPVIDITHKPKRMQTDNISASIREDSSGESTVTSNNSEVPSVVTLERAIKFYESHAQGEYKNLYSSTAKWLREFMSKSVPVEKQEIPEDLL